MDLLRKILCMVCFQFRVFLFLVDGKEIIEFDLLDMRLKVVFIKLGIVLFLLLDLCQLIDEFCNIGFIILGVIIFVILFDFVIYRFYWLDFVLCIVFNQVKKDNVCYLNDRLDKFNEVMFFF